MLVWCRLALASVLLVPSSQSARLKYESMLSSVGAGAADLERAFVGVDDRVLLNGHMDSGLVTHPARRESAGVYNHPSETVLLPDTWEPYISGRQKVGNGAYGDVAKFSLSCPHHEVITCAMKVIKDDIKSDKEKYLLNNEMSALTMVTNLLKDPKTRETFNEDMRPYVVSLIAKPTVADGHLFLVSPFFNGGDFKKVMNKQKDYGGKEAMYGFMLHFAKGVAIMHEAGWVHGDLKGENTMISCVGNSTSVGDCHGVVIDFGLSCRTDSPNCGRVGSPLFVAPEVLRRPPSGATPDPKSDIWSLGMMLWEIRFGYYYLPTQAGSLPAIFRKVGTYDQFGVSVPELESEPELDQLLQGMLANDVDKRFDIYEVIRRLTTMAPVKMRSFDKFSATDTVDCLQPDYVGNLQPKSSMRSVVKEVPQGGETIEQGQDVQNSSVSASAIAITGEEWQCCWTAGYFIGKDSHYMTKAGVPCKKGMKVFYDYDNCNSLADGSCSSCWASCCQTRHYYHWLNNKCTDSSAARKRTRHCSEVGNY